VFLSGTALTAGGGLPLGDKSGMARDICYSGVGCYPDCSRLERSSKVEVGTAG